MQLMEARTIRAWLYTCLTDTTSRIRLSNHVLDLPRLSVGLHLK